MKEVDSCFATTKYMIRLSAKNKGVTVYRLQVAIEQSIPALNDRYLRLFAHCFISSIPTKAKRKDKTTQLCQSYIGHSLTLYL